MSKSPTKSRPSRTAPPSGRSTPGRPPRAPGRERRQIVVDTALLNAAMRVTRTGQSDTVNTALAEFTENAAILAGVTSLFGAFPDHLDLDIPE